MKPTGGLFLHVASWLATAFHAPTHGHSRPPIPPPTPVLLQIFHNLIGNSCKFTHNGQIAISAVLKGDVVDVSVTDTGIGIPEDRFEHIFEAFEQARGVGGRWLDEKRGGTMGFDRLTLRRWP